MPSTRRRSPAPLMPAALCALPVLAAAASSAPPAAERPAELAGLYRMEVPEAQRPSARLRFPATEVTLLRLRPDGGARLENVTLVDRAGTVAAQVEVGALARAPWEVRRAATSGAGALPLPAELCVPCAGAVQCHRYERDAATGDVALYAGATPGSLVLRLERVR